MATYDILKGGTKKLITDLENHKKKLETLNINLNMELAQRLIEIIQQEAQSIDYNYAMYSAVYNMNKIVFNGNTITVVNTSQEATYSEYGTGIVGSRTPHPNNQMGWEYDVNGHGEHGWRYKLGDKYYFTKGVVSNPVYLRSAQRLRKELPNIIRKHLRSGNNE